MDTKARCRCRAGPCKLFTKDNIETVVSCRAAAVLFWDIETEVTIAAGLKPDFAIDMALRDQSFLVGDDVSVNKLTY